MAGRARLVAQGVALAGVVALLGLLVWKVAFEDTGGAAARLERGERPRRRTSRSSGSTAAGR